MLSVKFVAKKPYTCPQWRATRVNGRRMCRRRSARNGKRTIALRTIRHTFSTIFRRVLSPWENVGIILLYCRSHTKVAI